MLAASVIVLLFGFQQSPLPCADAPTCRAAAIEAQSRKDFEAFHDLAWTAYRKGRTGDPELMLLLARAQSLSGRPGDALVMLKRLAERGAPTDAATSEDFARVRALPEWSGESASASSAAAVAPTSAAAAVAGEPGSASPASPAVTPAIPVTPTPAATPPTSGRPAKPPRTSKGPPSAPAASSSATPPPVVTPPAGASPEVAPPPSVSTATTPPSPPAVVPAGKPAAKAKRDPAEPLKFATVLTPSALAYDAVSRRFIIADRSARRIAVIDENTGQVATLVGAQGALGDIGGIAIDPVQGDLWVVASDGDGLALHRMQLISGRVLSSSSLKGITGGVVALAFARSAGLVLADGTGMVWRIRANGRSDKLAALEYVPRALATDADGRLYVAGGGQRLARFALEPSMRKIDVVELAAGLPPDAPFAIVGGRLGVVVPSEGGYEIRTILLRGR
ncbi:hypothetical protein BH18ACI5_BH18ACI5_25180 [soil metagenome]